MREVRKMKLYLAAMTLGAFLAAGSMPLTAQAASLSPNAGGTIIEDTDVPLDDGGANGLSDEGEAEVTSIEDGEVPLSSKIMGNGCSFTFHLLLLLGGAVVGAVGMKTVDTIGKKEDADKRQ